MFFEYHVADTVGKIFQLKNSSVVVDITPDLTVYLLLNVILTEFIRVVIAGGKESVVTQQIMDVSQSVIQYMQLYEQV